jgi:UDP-2,3-diacylglucosamine pyrophosphatase LpxH
MVVFISDLHLADGTAAVHVPPPAAFAGAFKDIAQHAENAQSQEVILVFLGDIFDMIRTTFWINLVESERPWAIPENPQAVEQHALRLLEDILNFDKNSTTLQLIRDFQLPDTTVTRVYVPGNHDRVCNQFPILRDRVAQALGIPSPPPSPPFSWEYENRDYDCFARHGHEWDEWNFEFTHLMEENPAAIQPGHYDKVPIGEVITSEIAAKLPGCVRDELRSVPDLTDPQRNAIASRFMTIDDVRPLAAILPWLLGHLRHTAKAYPSSALDAIKRAIDRVLREFRDLDFTRQWLRDHDTWYFLDQADKVQGILAIVESLNVSTLIRGLPSVERFLRTREGDNHASDAARELQRLNVTSDQPFLYLLYGHTHTPVQRPIGTLDDGRGLVYLNTGTWRPLCRQATATGEFMAWKTLTYTILYHPQRDPESQAAKAGYPTFETWTGSLLEP